MNIGFYFGFGLLFILNNCEVVHTQSQDGRSLSREEFLWKSLVPFYIEEALLEINSTDNYEQVLFDKVSKSCQLDTMEWIAQLFNMSDAANIETWALTLIDAWGKPPSGILNQKWSKAALGDYDECVGLRAKNTANNLNFQGKYCLAMQNADYIRNIKAESGSAQKNLKSDITSHVLPLFGSCVPSSCSKQDANHFVQNIWNLLHLEQAISFEILDCFTSDKHGVDGWQTMIFVLAFLVFISVMAAVFEANSRKKLNVREGYMRQAFVSFSLVKNLKTWLKSDEETEMPCLHGIKFLTVAWIILVHTWEMPFLGYLSTWKLYDFEASSSNWSSLLITNGAVAMDTLFTISGITVTYSLLIELDKFKGKINILTFYLRRLLRFTPTYAVVIGFMATLYLYLGDGPFSGYINRSAQNCQLNWWKNLLYVNNVVNANYENMCLTDSWYFATEMQFILLTPFLVFVLWKYTRFGLGLLCILLVGSILTPGLLTFDGKGLPSAITNRDFYQYFEDIHVKPWIRASPFLVGILCGYLLHSRRQTKMVKALVVASWLISTAVALAIIFVLFPYVDPHTSIPVAGSSVYAGLHRCGWGFVISWTIFACVNGYGGWVNTFLSFKVFRPLSRLTVTAFLVSLPVQMILHLRLRELIVADTYTKVNLFLADLVMTFFVASLVTLFVELPCIQMEMAYLQQRNEDYEMNHPIIEIPPRPERYGIYYNSDLSLCMEENSGRRRKGNSLDARTQSPRLRERYGIYYEKNASVSIDLSKMPSHG